MSTIYFQAVSNFKIVKHDKTKDKNTQWNIYYSLNKKINIMKYVVFNIFRALLTAIKFVPRKYRAAVFFPFP